MTERVRGRNGGDLNRCEEKRSENQITDYTEREREEERKKRDIYGVKTN